MSYFDLYHHATSNPEFRNKIQRVQHNISLAEKSGNREAMGRHMGELLRLCEYNTSLLVPYFFPKYPKREPMSLWNRPHAFSMMWFTINGELVVNASRQTGKCVSGDTAITVRGPSGEIREETLGSLFDRAKADAAS